MRPAFLWVPILWIAIDCEPTHAQGGPWKFAGLSHRAELVGYAGYGWTSSYAVFFENTTGEIDIEDELTWGIEIDVNAQPAVQAALVYNRMDSQFSFQRKDILEPRQSDGDVAVEYWHIGALGGTLKGNVLPYGGLSVGGTRYIAFGEDAWKFSLMPQVGLKFYPSDRIGLRLQARLPLTFVNSGFTLGGGSSGAYVSVDGTGVAQFDLSAAMMILI